ncbi:MAG: hypothetical protein FD159_836 [Syntrophaceae bacterium]|nr:MAG: hypothetical protein FD159_836 [Syntrophaceae bacterium]
MLYSTANVFAAGLKEPNSLPTRHAAKAFGQD